MVINSKSVVFVNGRQARVLSNRFNNAVRRNIPVTDAGGSTIVPSKSLSWVNVASLVRSGKAVQARVAR